MQRLTTVDQRSSLIALQSVLIVYKHNSNQCPISARILPEIEQFADEYEHTIVAVDIIEHRDVSTAITEYAGIRHESPQCIIFDWRSQGPSTGACKGAVSHGRIKPDRIRATVEQ